jgi:opacity protein-like surface antigen
MLRSSGYPGRWLVAVSFVLAALSAAVVAVWLALGNDATLMCDFGEASSLFGSADRTWLPPGTTCSWNVNGIEHVDSPDPSRFAVLAMALLGVPLGLYLRRVLRPAHDDAVVDTTR